MLQQKNIRLGGTVSDAAVMSANPVLKDGRAYVRLSARRSGHLPMVYEFVRQGRRWRCVGAGRPDYPPYVALFSNLVLYNPEDQT